MTRTKKILDLLTTGEMTTAQIMLQLGLDRTQMNCAIRDMTRMGYIQSKPVTYSLTPFGKERVTPQANH